MHMMTCQVLVLGQNTRGVTWETYSLVAMAPFAHQRDQNLLTHTLSFYNLNDGKGRNALTFLYKRGEELKSYLL